MAKSKYFPDLTNGESVADVEQIETAFALVEKDMENAGEKADQTFSSTSKNAQSGVAIDGELAKYVKKETGKSLSTNDYTDAEKQKNANNATGVANNAASIAALQLNKADESKLLDYVKFTDYASADKAGVVQIDTSRGICISPIDHVLYVKTLDTVDIGTRSSTIGTLSMDMLNYAVRAALTDSNRISDMSDLEKSNAREVIGAEVTPYVYYHTSAGGVSLYNRSDNRISANVTPIILVVPTSAIGTDYECSFSFQSGSTATTLTYPGDTIKFVGVDCDESGDFIPTANRNYEVVVKNLSADSANPVLVARVGVY